MKWSIRESVDVYFKALSTFKLGARTIRKDEPILIFDSVKTSTLEVTSEMSYVTGGRGNSRLLSFEGDKVMSFSFEDALLSAEGLAILAGADLLPARNKNLPGASPDAKSVVSHFTETYSVESANIADTDATNRYDSDPALGRPPRGAEDNIWLSRKPYIGQNASIHVILQDHAGEMSGAPIAINLDNTFTEDSSDPINAITNQYSYLRKFKVGDQFIPFDANGMPMPRVSYMSEGGWGKVNVKRMTEEEAVFDDQVAHYVFYKEGIDMYWPNSWGEVEDYLQTIRKPADNEGSDDNPVLEGAFYYLVGQPKAFKEGTKIVYKVNCPSILYQDIVLIDYYVEYQHDATQISILPDKFAPYVYVEGSSLVRRASDGKDLPCEFVIPKLKITTALTFTLTSSGDASTFNFQGDAYPAFSKFDLTRKVLADIQILDADDNYDSGEGEDDGHPTSYRRFRYNIDGDGEYIWKDPSIEAHSNIDVSDAPDYNSESGGPATRTPGKGSIDTYSGSLELTNLYSSGKFGGNNENASIKITFYGEVKVTTNKGLAMITAPVGTEYESNIFASIDEEGFFNNISRIRLSGEITKVSISNIAGIANISSTSTSTSLTSLSITNCTDIKTIDLDSFKYLTELTLDNIKADGAQQNVSYKQMNLPSFANLKTLQITNTELEEIDGDSLPVIETINLSNNPKLGTLVFRVVGFHGSPLKDVNVGGTALVAEDANVVENLKLLCQALPQRTKEDPGTLALGSSEASTELSEADYFQDEVLNKNWNIIPNALSYFNLEIEVHWTDETHTEDLSEVRMGVRGDDTGDEDGILVSIKDYEEDYLSEKEDWVEEDSLDTFYLKDVFDKFFANEIPEYFTIVVRGKLTKLMAEHLPITRITDVDSPDGTLASQQILLLLDLSDTALTRFDAGPWMNSLTDLRVTNNEKLTEIELD